MVALDVNAPDWRNEEIKGQAVRSDTRTDCAENPVCFPHFYVLVLPLLQHCNPNAAALVSVPFQFVFVVKSLGWFSFSAKTSENFRIPLESPGASSSSTSLGPGNMQSK